MNIVHKMNRWYSKIHRINHVSTPLHRFKQCPGRFIVLLSGRVSVQLTGGDTIHPKADLARNLLEMHGIHVANWSYDYGRIPGGSDNGVLQTAGTNRGRLFPMLELLKIHTKIDIQAGTIRITSSEVKSRCDLQRRLTTRPRCS